MHRVSTQNANGPIYGRSITEKEPSFAGMALFRIGGYTMHRVSTVNRRTLIVTTFFFLALVAELVAIMVAITGYSAFTNHRAAETNNFA